MNEIKETSLLWNATVLCHRIVEGYAPRAVLFWWFYNNLNPFTNTCGTLGFNV